MASEQDTRDISRSWLRVPVPYALILVLGAVMYLFVTQYRREELRLVESTQAAFSGRIDSLEGAVDHLITHLDLADNWADGFWTSGIDDVLFEHVAENLVYRAEGDYFEWETSDDRQGSLWGVGTFLDRDSEFRKDVSLSFGLLTFFRGAMAESDVILRAYFFSNYQLSSIYPAVPASFFIEQTGMTLPDAMSLFYDPHEGLQLNTDRAPYFLKPYMDRAGHGLMVTYVHPVYEGDRFVGVMASDISLQFLLNYTGELGGLPSTLLLVAQDGQVIADSRSLIDGESRVLRDRLPDNLKPYHDEIAAGGLVRKVGRQYVNSQRLINAPWTFVQIIDRATVSSVLLGSQITYAAGGLAIISLFLIAHFALRRRKTEVALRETELKYKEVFDSTGDAVLIHDAETGRVLEANLTFLQATKYSLEEAKNLGIGQISEGVPPFTGEEAEKELAQAAEGKTRSIEWRIRYKNGEPRWVEVNLKAAVIHGEKRVVAVLRDIQDRKDYEAELGKYRGQLEALVEERTRELKEAQTELVKNEKLAILGQLTATVSHELRNPLGTIDNSLYVLTDHAAGGSEQVLEALSRAQRNVSRCNKIVDELLDFTRTRKLELSTVHLEHWISAVLSEKKPPEGIQHQVHLDAEVQIDIDPERLRRCMINLLDNAHQAIASFHDTGGTVKIDTFVDEERVFVRIADNGPGLPDVGAGQVYEPLFSTKGFGVGLGLPIAVQIVRAHGGELNLSDGAQGGATAEFWLPLTVNQKAPL